MKKNTLLGLIISTVAAATCGSAFSYSDPSNWPYSVGWRYNHLSVVEHSTKVYAGQHDANTPVYVCQHGNLPGKLTNGKCYVPYRGREYGSTSYKALYVRYKDLEWRGRLGIPFVAGALPNEIRSDAVIGGQEGGYDVFICKGKHYNHTVVGKFVRGHGCYFSHNGREHLLKVSEDNFYVLTDKRPGF
ncbi:DM9 repeat-containing protein (plasmid) [Pseudoalteromonas sp. T1lg65]|uniref:DM9 repeat-containing protein n=1 Tax=Pseudoalteromonas sp. T1lg65 TaxID=2077101 RepID=UPI003F7A9C34